MVGVVLCAKLRGVKSQIKMTTRSMITALLLPLKKGSWEGLRCELQILQRNSKRREELNATQSP